MYMCVGSLHSNTIIYTVVHHIQKPPTTSEIAFTPIELHKLKYFNLLALTFTYKMFPLTNHLYITLCFILNSEYYKKA